MLIFQRIDFSKTQKLGNGASTKINSKHLNYISRLTIDTQTSLQASGIAFSHMDMCLKPLNVKPDMH